MQPAPSVTDSNLAPISSLSKMMVDSAREALRQDDYVNALEYVISVASVDNHPDITIALAVTVLEVINSIELAEGALTTKARLLRALAGRHDPKYYAEIRRLFDVESLLHVLKLTRLFASGDMHNKLSADDVVVSLINKIDGVANGSAKNSPITLADLQARDGSTSRELVLQSQSDQLRADLQLRGSKLIVSDRKDTIAMLQILLERTERTRQEILEIRDEERRFAFSVVRETRFNFGNRWRISQWFQHSAWVAVVSSITTLLVHAYALGIIDHLMDLLNKIVHFIYK